MLKKYRKNKITSILSHKNFRVVRGGGIGLIPLSIIGLAILNPQISRADVEFHVSEDGQNLNITVPENETYDLDLSKEEFNHVNTINKAGEGNLNILKLKYDNNLNLEGGVNTLKSVDYDVNNSFAINKLKTINSKFVLEDDIENVNQNDYSIRSGFGINIFDVVLNNSTLEFKNEESVFLYNKIIKEGEGKNKFIINKKAYDAGKIGAINNTRIGFFDDEELEEKNLTFLNNFNSNDEIVLNRENGISIWSNYGGGSLDLGNIKFKTATQEQDYNFINIIEVGNKQILNEFANKPINPNGIIFLGTHRQTSDNPNWTINIDGDNFKEYYGAIHSFIAPINIVNGNLENTELDIFSINDSGDTMFLKASARPVKIFNLKLDGGIKIDIDSDDNYTQYQVKKNVVFYKNSVNDKKQNTLDINVKNGIKLTKNKLENIISSEDETILFLKEIIERNERGDFLSSHYVHSDVKFEEVTDNSLLYDFIPEYYDNHIDLKVVKLEEDDESDPDDSDSHASTEEHPNQNEPSVGNTDNTTTDTTHVDSPSQSKQLEKIIKKRGKRADLLTETNLVPYLDNLLNKAESIEKIDETNLTEEQQLAKQAKTHFIQIENEEEVEKVIEETLPIENLLDKERVFRQLHKINSFTHRHQLQFGNQKLQKLCQFNQNNNWYGNLLAEKGKFGKNLKTYDYGFTLGLDKVLDEGENCKDFEKPKKLNKLGFNLSVIKGTGKTEKTQFENLNFIASIYGNKVLREYYDIELLSQASLGYSQSKLTNNYGFYQTQSTQKPDYLLGSLSLGLAKEFNLVETDNISLLLKPYSFLTYQALSTSSTHNKIVDESKDKLLDYSINKHYQQTLSQEIGVMQQFTLKELTKLNLQTGLSLTFDWLNTQKPLYFKHKDGSQHFLNPQQGKGFKGLKTVKGFLDISYQLNPMTTINSYYQFEKGLKNNNSYQHQIGVGLEIKY